ncbi:MAG TPA: hypothetical protein VFE44_06745, partial [Thermoanaerobaculia bacterium]|nr:hypothetical protein [Thermoanaerobaculia bacterium]
MASQRGWIGRFETSLMTDCEGDAARVGGGAAGVGGGACVERGRRLPISQKKIAIRAIAGLIQFSRSTSI